MFSFCQDEYKASNGITYREGDKIKIGKGSAPDGTFLWVQVYGLATTVNGDKNANNMTRANGSAEYEIKKFKSWKGKKYLTLKAGGINYLVDIEAGIEACEILPCPEKVLKVESVAKEDKYDKLAKLKKLLDDKAITQEEYDKEKSKIMEGN